MKLFILLLILAILIQSTLLPINFCLILLICRSFAVDERQNYYLAFFSGIFLGLLSNTNIGFYSVAFLIFVAFTRVVKRSALSESSLVILPLSFILLAISAYLEKIFFNQTINWLNIGVTLGLSLPLYFFVRFWEERFIVKPQIKLKIRS